MKSYIDLSHFCLFSPSQKTKDPLPPNELFEIWDNIKERGVLVGRGGLYGTVRNNFNIINVLHYAYNYSFRHYVSSPQCASLRKMLNLLLKLSEQL